MKIIVLIDNNSDSACCLNKEHGLAIYFEKDGKKYLYDTGASALFIENAQKLGIDISDIDALILSHLHDDHTGGLHAFMQANHKAIIYLSDKAPSTRCYSLSSGTQREISIDFSCINAAPRRFRYISDSFEIAPGITLLSCRNGFFACPKGNNTMMKSDRNGSNLNIDDFSHEIAIILSEDTSQSILSACSHNGFLNIIHNVKLLNPALPIKSFIGGLHFPNAKSGQQLEHESDFNHLAKQLKELSPETQIVTGHCTGSDAIAALSKYIFVETFYSGYTIL